MSLLPLLIRIYQPMPIFRLGRTHGSAPKSKAHPQVRPDHAPLFDCDPV